jgi:hypothetical protein
MCDPGATISISSDIAFKTAVSSTEQGSGGFEVGDVSIVLLPGALAPSGVGIGHVCHLGNA